MELVVELDQIPITVHIKKIAKELKEASDLVGVE